MLKVGDTIYQFVCKDPAKLKQIAAIIGKELK
jgi:hypothetical protein